MSVEEESLVVSCPIDQDIEWNDDIKSNNFMIVEPCVNNDIPKIVQQVLIDLIDDIHLQLSTNDSVNLKNNKLLNRTHRRPKRRIFSSSEDDSDSSSSSSDITSVRTDVIDEAFDSDDDEKKLLANRHGPRTRNELTIDDLPPIENLTITLSDETQIEKIGHVRYIIEEKYVIVESLLNSSPLNDDSVLFNSERKSIGLIYETLGPVIKPYYLMRFNHIDEIKKRQLLLGQDVYYAPKETTYTKYVFIKELLTLKGSDASWKDDHEPPTTLVDYSDDDQEKQAKDKRKKKKQNRNDDHGDVKDNVRDEGMSLSEGFGDYDDIESLISEQSSDTFSSRGSKRNGRHRGRGRNRGQHQQQRGRPPPSLPNWFQQSPHSNQQSSNPHWTPRQSNYRQPYHPRPPLQTNWRSPQPPILWHGQSNSNYMGLPQQQFPNTQSAWQAPPSLFNDTNNRTTNQRLPNQQEPSSFYH